MSELKIAIVGAGFVARIVHLPGYAGVRQPVSAKCYDFGPDGDETTIDFSRMIDIVKEAGYGGYVGIEFEGERLQEREGVLAAKALLERLV